MTDLRMILSVPVALLALAWTTPAPAAPDYIGATKCKMCHKVEFASWSELPHAKAFDQLKPAEQTKAECLKCHATNASAELPGVQCEACHGPGGEYKSLKVMKDREASIAAGLLLPDEAACRVCHEGAPHDQKPFDYEKARAGGVHEMKNPR